MDILITGAAGMIGRKLTSALSASGQLRGEPIGTVHLVDVVEPASVPDGWTTEVADLSEPGVVDALAARHADVVFHLAGVVSGEAEADFDKGMRVNLDGTRLLFEALRHAPGQPRVVFTSSIAVFGAPFPDPIPDDFHLTPLTSYGTEKMIGEALLADFSRREFFDGVGIRLPTISVRPGAPNAAASGFFSGIIREPLNGQRAVLPVSRDVRHSHASPRTAVRYLLHAAELDSSLLGARRNLTMPGVSVTVGEQLEALERVAGAEAVALVDEAADATIAGIVAGWPTRFATPRAESLGFTADDSYDDIIRAYVEDDLDASS